MIEDLNFIFDDMRIGKYYIDLYKLIGEDFSGYQFDENGVPLTRFPQKNWKYNPVTVCQYGLWQFNLGIENQSQSSFQRAIKQADWLLKNGVFDEHGALVWKYQMDLPFYNLSAPWVSGMAQAQAISLLLRVHQISDKEQYQEAAKKAFLVFKFKVNEGGVVANFPDGLPLIEEYPSPETSAVLNGFIFSLFGIYDFSIYFRDNEASSLFESLVESLDRNIYHYDCGYWSYYDLAKPRRLASRIYHRLHIEQLKKLAEITHNVHFFERAELWQRYYHSVSSNFKWFFHKVNQKLIHRV